MTHKIEFSKEFVRIFEKLQHRNKKQAEIIVKKIREIRENPTHYKPLCDELKGYRRVHIDSSFVLAYRIEGETIVIMDYDHHDTIYEKLKQQE